MQLGRNTGDGAGLRVAFLLAGMLAFLALLAASAPTFGQDATTGDTTDNNANVGGDTQTAINDCEAVLDQATNINSNQGTLVSGDGNIRQDGNTVTAKQVQYCQNLLDEDSSNENEDQYGEDQYGDENNAEVVSDVISGDQEGDEEAGNCENAQKVDTFEGSPGEDFVTDPFEITGEQFRVSFDSDGTGFVFADIEILDDEGELVDTFITGGEGQQDFLIVNGGPGNFVLDVTADTDDPFTVSVESCGDAGGNDNDGDADDGVIDDTVPDKDLPNTGGFPLIVAGGAAILLVYGGLVARRLRTRER